MCQEKITKDTYDAIAKTWDTKREFYWKPVVEFVERIEHKENKKFLDLGCGAGRHLILAKEKGFKQENIFGSDYSQGQLREVEKKGFNTVLSNMIELPFEENSIDIMVCIAAHHHLLNSNEQLLALKEMNRILKGELLLCNWFPEEKFLEEQIKKGKFEFEENSQIGKVTFDDHGEKYDRYYYFFKEEELMELCQEAGFTIKEKFYEGGNLYLRLSK